MKVLRKHLKRLQKTHDELKSTLDRERRMREFVHRSKKRSKRAVRWNMSLRGGYKLAFLRNRAHCSLTALRENVDTHFSSKTIARWERLFATSLLLQSRAWYTYQYLYLQRLWASIDSVTPVASPQESILTWEAHSLRADSTNSNVMQSCNAQVNEI